MKGKPHEGPRPEDVEAAKTRGERMVKVKFLEDVTTKVGDASNPRQEDADHFEKDKVYEMGERQAQKWIRRQKAEEVEGGRRSAPAPVAASTAPDKK